MSDHFDGDDPRTDLTDVYVFPARATGRTVLVMCVNPEPLDGELPVDPSASYELKIDTDGDALPEVAFHVRFEAPEAPGGSAMATVHRVDGRDADGTGAIGTVLLDRVPISAGDGSAVAEAGPYRFFAGTRSDPFFKDVLGFRNGFQFTGADPIAKRNVFGIALELPTESVETRLPWRVWARTMVPVHGTAEQADRAGRPSINNVLSLDTAVIEAFRATSPADQRDQFTAGLVAFLASVGYSSEEATTIAAAWLPDWLEYDPAQPAGYPNGRHLTDDISDRLATLLTRGRITSDGAGPHTDLLPDFPFLGPPHAVAGPTV